MICVIKHYETICINLSPDTEANIGGSQTFTTKAPIKKNCVLKSTNNVLNSNFTPKYSIVNCKYTSKLPKIMFTINVVRNNVLCINYALHL